MSYAPTMGERLAFVESTIEAAHRTLTDPNLPDDFHPIASKLAEIISMGEHVAIVDGEVQLPNGEADEESFPMLAISPDETLTLSNDLYKQVPGQKEATLEKFKSWGAETETAEWFYDKTVGLPSSRNLKNEITMPSDTAAVTGYAQTLIKASALEPYFETPPTSGLITVMTRPFLYLEMSSGKRRAEPYVLAHELTHAYQINKRPVSKVHSQTSVELGQLRLELEAYHIGAYFTFKEYQENGGLPEATDTGLCLFQLMVERIRRESADDPGDPFRPSKELFKKLGELQLDVLHGNPSYEHMLTYAIDRVV